MFKIYKDPNGGMYYLGEENDTAIGLAGLPTVNDTLVQIGMEIKRRDIKIATIYLEGEILTKLEWLDR